MKIIAHKSMKYDYYKFLNDALTNPTIVGVSFDVLMTKDKKIIIYTPYGNYTSTINAMQKNSFEDLKEMDILTLEETIKRFANGNKKIIINLLPIINPPITELNLSDIVRLNEEYVLTVKAILDKFPTLNFYLCSAYDNLVFQIRKLNDKHKVGLVLTNLSTTYQDVDFYAFTANVIDERLVNQLLNFNKEVMIYLLNCDELSDMLDWVSRKITSRKFDQNAFNEIYFINNYTDIFWRLFHQLS